MEPQIIKPLHGLAPRAIMGKEWWDYNRKKAYEKNNFHCFACGIHKNNAKYHQWLEAHESYSIDFDKKQYELVEIVALCHVCHNFIHAGRLQILFEKGEISKEKYQYVHEYGNTLLELNDLDKSKAWWTEPGVIEKFFPEKDGTWSEWHLIIDDKKYYSNFKDYEEWLNYYSRHKDND